MQTERNVNFDVGRDIDTGFTVGPMSLAMGAEWREESFKISQGNILTLSPPMVIARAELDRALDIVEQAILAG